MGRAHGTRDRSRRDPMCAFSSITRIQLISQGVTMAGKNKTSGKAAKAASKVLKDGRTSKKSKTSAGSALSQAPGKATSKKVKATSKKAKNKKPKNKKK
jgi:hypothetical protein